MPVIHRQRLAARLRQNWSTMYPTESTSHSNMFQVVDDSLTSLAWLQNLNVMKLSSANAAATRSTSLQTTPPQEERSRGGVTVATYRRGLSEDSALARLQVDPNDILDMTNKHEGSAASGGVGGGSNWNLSVSTSTQGVVSVLDEAASAACQLERDRYRYEASIKPPYSYALLICMAMQETPDKRITLAQIYSWISENFAYYKQADQNWQHSIRHNLSLNKCFQKVPRGKDEPGKGGFWTINPDFNNLVDRGIFKKRRLTFSADPSSVGPKKESTPSAQFPYKREYRGSPGREAKTSDPVLDFRTDSLTDVLDLHWALNQDIEIGGLSVKTGDIIDMQLTTTPAMLASTSLESPPPSDSDSDLELNSLLNFSAFHAPSSMHIDATEQRNEDSLDLTVHGVGLPPPNWWNESLNGHFRVNEDAVDLFSTETQNDDRMHTPSLSRFDDNNFHPWAENRNEGISDPIMAFDVSPALIDSENLDVTDSFRLL